jgi:ectoine hydroxylase-related dioxygenase (phytanoyl-CoA dioxygenase family)
VQPKPLAEIITRDVLSAAELDTYRECGWVLVRGLLDRAAVATIATDIRAVLAARNMADSFLAQSSEYLAGSPIHRLVGNERLRGLAGQLMSGPAHLYLPFTAVKGPGQGEFTFHQDGQYTQFDGPGLNCWFSLVPCTPANGCLRLVSGTHRAGMVAWKESPQCPGHRTLVEQPSAWEDVAMEPGDCCIFDRMTVHGSGPNGTADPRIAYAVQFHRADTKALFDGSWQALTERPRWPVGPVAAFTDAAQRGE